MTCFPFFYLEKLPFLFFRTFSPQILYRHIPYSNFSEVRSLTLTLICFCVLLGLTFCWPLSCFSPGIVRLSTFVSLASYRLGLATLPPIPRRRNSTQSSSCFWDVSLDVVFYVSMLGLVKHIASWRARDAAASTRPKSAFLCFRLYIMRSGNGALL